MAAKETHRVVLRAWNCFANIKGEYVCVGGFMATNQTSKLWGFYGRTLEKYKLYSEINVFDFLSRYVSDKYSYVFGIWSKNIGQKPHKFAIRI